MLIVMLLLLHSLHAPCGTSALHAPRSYPACLAMAPHLTPCEQDAMLKAKAQNKSTTQIFAMVATSRKKVGALMVNVTVVRRFLRGTTHKRGAKETRGRPPTYSRRNVLTMNTARLRIIKKSKGGKQATWGRVVATSRAPPADPTTAARAFAREGIAVRLRRSREKPQRTPEQEQEREEICGKMRRWPLTRFTDDIDMIIDNKRFETPATPEGREHVAKQKVVAQLRTRTEGLKKHFTKPSAKRHRKYTWRICKRVR